jgi:hypothetical protein
MEGQRDRGTERRGDKEILVFTSFCPSVPLSLCPSVSVAAAPLWLN